MFSDEDHFETLTLMHPSSRADAVANFVGFWQRLQKDFCESARIPSFMEQGSCDHIKELEGFLQQGPCSSEH
jgi:hypothetical protein